MTKLQYEIECSRCGAKKVELLSEAEAEGIRDRISPIHRLCDQCGRTTGWIEVKDRRAPAENTEN